MADIYRLFLGTVGVPVRVQIIRPGGFKLVLDIGHRHCYACYVGSTLKEKGIRISVTEIPSFLRGWGVQTQCAKSPKLTAVIY